MGLQTFISRFPWNRYSRKLAAKIDMPKAAGVFSPEEAEARDLKLVDAVEGKKDDGNCVRLFWLVDRDDGIIVDARFQAYGQSALIGAAEIACELLVGKNYDQARRISADLVDKQVRDKADEPAFPKETFPHLNLVLGAIEKGAEQCEGLPLAATYVAPPAPVDFGEVREDGYPGWQELSKDQKLQVIEEVLDQDVRPYIALDAGGVSVIDFINDKELLIAYHGTCTSCYSSVGTTLSYIQQVLRAKVLPGLVVTPELGDGFT